MILVTGGAGFIGSNFIRKFTKDKIIVFDALTYAGMCENVPKHIPIVQGDIRDRDAVRAVIRNNRIREVYHFAAESHVDRSIKEPNVFSETNVLGTGILLSECKDYWGKSKDVYFHHVSTDEVYGSLSLSDLPSKEDDRYDPRSPYAASKASSDHLVRAYCHTFNFPAVITNCTNNYGARQGLEKLIPLVIDNIINRASIPVYGDGQQIRDWLHVDDHISAILSLRNYFFDTSGSIAGEVFNVGAGNQKPNLEVIRSICQFIDEKPNVYYDSISLIEHIRDREAHDRRYSLNFSKIKNLIGWKPEVGLLDGLQKTVDWYLQNQLWSETYKTKSNHGVWMKKNYAGR